MVRKVAPGKSRDVLIACIAAEQHGVITAKQLHGCDLTTTAISKRVSSGRLHRVYRGVYVVGSKDMSDEARWMAAVRACGDGAVLSHLSAAALWGLLRPFGGPIDVSIPARTGRTRRIGIRVHRPRSLAKASLLPHGGMSEEPIPAVTKRAGIPITAPWRTIEDLRGAVPSKLYRRALRQAELMRFALSPTTPRDRTRSDLERDFLRLCRDHNLGAPEVNVRIGPWTVDFVWRAEQLAVETDSWATHGSSVAFEDDHERDLDLRRRGLSVHRFTESQIRDVPGLVAADLAAELTRSRGRSAAKLSNEANNRP